MHCNGYLVLHDWSVMHHDGLMPHLSILQYTYAVVEEVDAEDEEGNISKELYILKVAPLESHAGYRLEAEDPLVFSDGREDDPDSWVCPRSWPHIPIPL